MASSGEERITIEGFLDKLGEKGLTGKKYQRRYFRLFGTELHYYKAQKDAVHKPRSSKGFIDLKRAMLIEGVLEDQAGSRNSQNKRASMSMTTGVRFVIKTPDRVYDLVAGSQKDMLHWVSTLNDVLTLIRVRRAEQNQNRKSITGSLDRTSSISDKNLKRYSEMPGGSPTLHTSSSGNLNLPKNLNNNNNNNNSNNDLRTNSNNNLRAPNDKLERRSNPVLATANNNNNSNNLLNQQKGNVQLPSSQNNLPFASQPPVVKEPEFFGRTEEQPLPNNVNLNEVVCLVERIASREWKESHQTTNKELDKALFDFREMKAVKNREESEKVEVQQHVSSFNQLVNFSEKEIECIDGLSNSINIVKRNSNQRQDVVSQAEKNYRTIESLCHQISSEHRIFLDIADKLEHLNKKLQAPSLLGHHQMNVENLSKEIEQMPEKLASIEQQIQQNDIELSRIANEKTAFYSLKIKIPDEIRKIGNRAHFLSEKLQRDRNALRELTEEKAKLESELAEHQKKKAGLIKQESSLNMFKKILNEPSWNEMLSTFSIVANLEQQANSLITELGDSHDSTAVATVDIDKKESLDQKARVLEERYEREKNDYNRIQNALTEQIEEKDRLIREKMKEISNAENELQAGNTEKTNLQNQLDELSKKLVDSESSKQTLELEQEKLYEKKKDMNVQFDEKQRKLEDERRKLREESQKKAELESEVSSQNQLKQVSYRKLCELFYNTTNQIDLLENLLKLERQLSSTILVGINEQTNIRSRRQTLLKDKLIMINQVRNECLKHHELSNVMITSASTTSSKEINETLEVTELLTRLTATETNLEIARKTERDLKELLVAQKSKEKELKEHILSFQLKERDFQNQINNLQSSISMKSKDDDKLFELQQKIIEQKNETDRLRASVMDWQSKAQNAERDLAESIRVNALLTPTNISTSSNPYDYNAGSNYNDYNFNNTGNNDYNNYNNANNYGNYNNNNDSWGASWGDSTNAYNKGYPGTTTTTNNAYPSPVNNSVRPEDQRLAELQQEYQKVRLENLNLRQKAQSADSLEIQLKEVQTQYAAFQLYHQESLTKLEAQRSSPISPYGSSAYSPSSELYTAQQVQEAAQGLAQELAQQMAQQMAEGMAMNMAQQSFEQMELERREKEEGFAQRIAQLKGENEELRSSNEFLKNKISKYEKSIASLEEKASSSSLKLIENSLREKESELVNLQRQFQSMEANSSIIQSTLHSSHSQFQQIQNELVAKDKTIWQLQQQLKSSSSSQNNKQKQKQKPKGKSDPQTEIIRLNNANFAHQEQNSQLQLLVSSLKSQIEGISNAKEKEIDNLRSQLDTLRKDYQELRLQSLINSGCDEKTLQDIESINWLKKEYFYSLAVSVKLEVSKDVPCNLDIFDLFEEVYNIPVQQWNLWITNRFYQYSKSMEKKKLPPPSPAIKMNNNNNNNRNNNIKNNNNNNNNNNQKRVAQSQPNTSQKGNVRNT